MSQLHRIIKAKWRIRVEMPEDASKEDGVGLEGEHEGDVVL